MRDFKIERSEVLRYLGHKGQSVEPEMDVMIDELISVCEASADPRYTYSLFDISFRNGKVWLGETNISLNGQDIYKHLNGAVKCAVLASTLGVPAEQKLLFYEKKSITEALIFDACCTALIERVTDQCESEILASAKGYCTNFRYSPGYGDLPLELQKDIITLLSAEKMICLTVTDDYILIPRKSVTAIVGLFSGEEKLYDKSENKCRNCNLYESCQLRKRGDSCV